MIKIARWYCKTGWNTQWGRHKRLIVTACRSNCGWRHGNQLKKVFASPTPTYNPLEVVDWQSHLDNKIHNKNPTQGRVRHRRLATYLEELGDCRIDHHQRAMNQVNDSILHRNVSHHDLSQHNACRVLWITNDRVRLHIHCGRKNSEDGIATLA